MPSSKLDPAALTERPPARRGREVAALLLLVGLLVWLANAGARRYLMAEGTNRGYRIVHTKWAMLEALDAPVDWLVLGDSTGAHGIVPEVWSETFGGRALNLAVIADLLVSNDAWMLERYIERFGPPKGVLVVHAHDVWHRSIEAVLLGQIDRPWGFWAHSRPPVTLDIDQTIAVFLARFLPLYADNRELRGHLWHRGQPRDPRLEISESGWIHGRGHMPAALRRDARRLVRHLESTTGFRLSAPNRAGLQQLGRLASKHGFPVFLSHAPMAEDITRLAAFRRYDESRNRRLEVIASAWKNLVLLPETASHPREEMEGHLDHLVPAVADDHTRRLAARVAPLYAAWRRARAHP